MRTDPISPLFNVSIAVALVGGRDCVGVRDCVGGRDCVGVRDSVGVTPIT